VEVQHSTQGAQLLSYIRAVDADREGASGSIDYSVLNTFDGGALRGEEAHPGVVNPATLNRPESVPLGDLVLLECVKNGNGIRVEGDTCVNHLNHELISVLGIPAVMSAG
jgi:hypothetical protein